MQKHKEIRRSLNVECALDKGVPAVFFCSRCNKPFCEDCIGWDSAVKTLCLHCAVVEDSKKEKAQRASLFSVAEKKSAILAVLGVIATIAIFFNLYILSSDFREGDQAERLEPNINVQLMDISTCRSNLEKLVKEAIIYQEAFEHAPSSISDLTSQMDGQAELKDPTTLESYLLDVDDSGNIIAHCPTPGAHGVADIVAVPQKPARIIYGGGWSL